MPIHRAGLARKSLPSRERRSTTRASARGTWAASNGSGRSEHDEQPRHHRLIRRRPFRACRVRCPDWRKCHRESSFFKMGTDGGSPILGNGSAQAPSLLHGGRLRVSAQARRPGLLEGRGRELDVVENEAFGRQMEEMFREDLDHATEIVLHRRARVRSAGNARPPRVRGAGGSTTRVAAGALRVGNALGSVLAARRFHGPAERWLMAEGGLLLAVLAALGFLWPRLLAWPLAAFSLWMGLSLLARSARRRAERPASAARE